MGKAKNMQRLLDHMEKKKKEMGDSTKVIRKPKTKITQPKTMQAHPIQSKPMDSSERALNLYSQWDKHYCEKLDYLQNKLDQAVQKANRLEDENRGLRSELLALTGKLRTRQDVEIHS